MTKHALDSDLDTGLLLKIMKRLGGSRGRQDVDTWVLRREFVTAEITGVFSLKGIAIADLHEQIKLAYVDRHVDFLSDIGLLTARQTGVYRTLELTAKGQMFVQPELLGFGDQKMWPQVLNALEKEIEVLTYPQDEKDGMIYRLREAVVGQVPDVIAKVIAEVFLKVAKGG